MGLILIRTFVTLAREGNLTRTAQRLHLPQAALRNLRMSGALRRDVAAKRLGVACSLRQPGMVDVDAAIEVLPLTGFSYHVIAPPGTGDRCRLRRGRRRLGRGMKFRVQFIARTGRLWHNARLPTRSGSSVG